MSDCEHKGPNRVLVPLYDPVTRKPLGKSLLMSASLHDKIKAVAAKAKTND